MTDLEWMERFAYSYANAYQFTDSTVWVNEQAPSVARQKLEQAHEPTCKPALFGVKDTNQISRDLVKRLAQHPEFMWLTVDRMAPHGRAVDTELTNPLTGRRMTGSSSGSAINILRGIHDLALATDGGGSILAPALATQLYGINAKGLGLSGRYDARSTDGYSLSVGVGVISHSLSVAKRAVEVLLAQPLSADVAGLSIALDQDLPDELAHVLVNSGCGVERFSKENTVQRDRGIALMQELFQRVDVIISGEGPVDVDTYADSIMTNGRPSERGGKYLLRSANLLDTTSIAVPGTDVACGYLVAAPRGKEAGRLAIAVAELIDKVCPRSHLFEEYFLTRMRMAHGGFFYEGV